MVLLALPPADHSDRKRSRPIRAFSATPHDGQHPCRTLAEDPSRTQPPSCVSPALQLKREWSPGPEFGWIPRKSVRPFKGIICDDISEIAVGTLITERPPHRSVRAQFGHTAPTLGV